MSGFWRHAAVMFLALRAGDVVNLAAGMWLVPKYVSPGELGAVLPVTTFATVLVMPVFAFAMTVMKVSSDLSGRGARGQLKTLWRGVFLGIGVLSVGALALGALWLPRYLARMRVGGGALVVTLVFAASLAGVVAPVYTDALQAIKRFRALGAIEFLAAAGRFAALWVLMPVQALAGYFAGNAVGPLVRIAGSVGALRRELAVSAEPYWTRDNVRTLAVRFVLIAAYLMVPMGVANLEQTWVRTALSATDSAGYYLVTRLTDMLNYVTYPLLIVLFPYAAEAARAGGRGRGLVVKACGVTLLAAGALGGVYAVWGERILGLMPGGAGYAAYLVYVPILLAITALTACQVFYTNAEVAAGRFGFLWWFLPLNAIYGLLIWGLSPSSMPHLLGLFLVGAGLRFVGACSFLFGLRFQV